jgi:DNA ligase-1
MRGVLLTELVEQVSRVRATSRKTEKVAVLADLLLRTEGRETGIAAHYLSGALPQGRIGVGWRAIQEASAEGPSPGPGPTLEDVDRVLGGIAASEGEGSAGSRRDALRGLMARVGPDERRFLGQLLIGELRQGAVEGLVQEAVAKAAALPPSTLRRAAMFARDIGEVAEVALREGSAGLARFSLRVLSPVAPMLASPAEDSADALARLGEAAFEYKLDGARIQVHRAGDDVRVFTRQLQDVTARVPELVDWVRALAARELVVEGEALALRSDGRPQPFQVTMRRLGRSKDVEAARREQTLSFWFFDCLLLEGEGPLVALPYSERAERLARVLPASALVPRLVTADVSEAEAFFRRALEAGHEGLMAKSLTAPYTAGQRGFHWLKIKQAKTLDLAVLAAEWGSGRRKGWLSNLHLGARDGDSGRFVMLGKTFKGLTDAMLRWQTEALLALEERRDDWTVHVRPELVVEVAFSDVQESPRYPGGLALRFARVKAHRPDKPASQADTLESVRALFDRQRA